MKGMTDGRRNKQRGIAAITSLLVVALATILAAELAWELHVDIQRTETMLLRNQAYQFALAGEMLAAEALRQDHEQDRENNQFCDSEDELWNQEQTFPFEGGTVRGRITGLQGRFNLNNLLVSNRKDQESVDFFVRLLDELNMDTNLAYRVLDWIDPDQLEEIGGAEDGVYTSRTPPYRAANTWFTTTSELLAIDGMIDPEEPGDERFRLLERYVTALPGFQKINVNMAEDPVLLAMAEEAGISNAEQLRANRPYCDLLSTDTEANAFLTDANGAIKPDFANKYLEVATNFFQLKVLVTLGTTQLTMYSLLYRDTNGVVTTKLRYMDTK